MGTRVAGDLKETDFQEQSQGLCGRRLPLIGKKRIEREDRGMITGQPVAPAYVHCLHDIERDTGHEGFFRGNREPELVHQSYDFYFEGLCCLLCPVEQVYEKFPDHCFVSVRYT